MAGREVSASRRRRTAQHAGSCRRSPRRRCGRGRWPTGGSRGADRTRRSSGRHRRSCMCSSAPSASSRTTSTSPDSMVYTNSLRFALAEDRLAVGVAHGHRLGVAGVGVLGHAQPRRQATADHEVAGGRRVAEQDVAGTQVDGCDLAEGRAGPRRRRPIGHLHAARPPSGPPSTNRSGPPQPGRVAAAGGNRPSVCQPADGMTYRAATIVGGDAC